MMTASAAAYRATCGHRRKIQQNTKNFGPYTKYVSGFRKKTHHKGSKFIQAHTGIAYFVVHYVSLCIYAVFHGMYVFQ